MQHPEDLGQSYYNASKMYRSIYEEKSSKSDLERAKMLLESITEDSKGKAMAPDALKELWDIAKNLEDSPREAKGYLKKILSDYPHSDLVDFAEKALSSSEDSSDKKDSSTSRSNLVIALDPGHGGEDFGAVGVSGLLEKDVVLDVAFKLQALIESQLHAIVILTRKSDVFVPLQRRMEMANEAGASVFLSIHCNSSEKPGAKGFEIYVLDNTNDQGSKTLSERENSSGGGAVDDISFMLSDLIQSSKSPESIKLAQSIEGSVSALKRNWSDITILKVKKAPFYVLVGAHMPAVLAELLFINENDDARKLADDSFRADMAKALLIGLKGYLHK